VTRFAAATPSTTRVYWLEEPIAYDNLTGYAQLTRELNTPVQLGETFYGPRALFRAIRGAGDYVMPDLMRMEGVTGWLRAAAIAGAAGVEMSTHRKRCLRTLRFGLDG